jgi:uncharacterized protein YggU (UPF0235/DUF167 family)
MNATLHAYVRVRVVPRAARAALARDASGVVRVHLTAPPVDGAANRALIALLAARLDLPKRALEIARGERGRDKLVRVHGCTAAELASRLETALGER